MKILQINQCHYKRGGADIVYLNTIGLLRSKGHEVACFSTINLHNEDSEYKDYFVPTVDLRTSSLTDKIKSVGPYIYNKKAYKNLNRLIRDFKPDVAHIHLFYASLSVAVLDALKENNIPILHTVHDYRFLCPISSCLDQEDKTCELCVEKSILSSLKKKCSDGKFTQSSIVFLESFYWKKIKHPECSIDLFHFVSDFCKEKYIKYFPEIRDKNILIYNNSGFIDTSNIGSVKFDKSDNKYFLFYGRLSIEKGLLTLLKAWESISPNITLKIVGRGPLESKIKEEIRKNTSHNIELLGFKTGIELQNLVQSASFVIIPSEWYENNPMTIIESYSLGTPVIGSDIGGIPEIIKNEETGYVFKYKSILDLKRVIIKSINISDIEYKQMSENVIEFAKINFSSENNYNKLIDAYKSIMK